MSTTAVAVTTVTVGRRRRSAPATHEEFTTVPQEKMTNELVLPMLTVVAHVRDGLVPPRCLYQPLCNTNRLLVKKLGHSHGSSVAQMISNAAIKFLTEGNSKKNKVKFLQAAKTGRTAKDDFTCSVEYQRCKLLDDLPSYVFPPGT